MLVIQGHSTSNPTTPSQYAAIEAFRGPQDSVKSMLADYQKRRDWLVKALCAVPGFSCVEPEGAFYAFPNVSGRRLINETIRRIINALIVDLIGTTRAGIADVAPRCIDDVRAAPALVAFSDPMREEARALKRFLFDNLYRHYLVMRMAAKARRIIDDLFRVFMDDPRLLPPQYQAKATPEEQPRWIAHYIAGMTDRYAFSEHARLVKNRSIENESLQLFP